MSDWQQWVVIGLLLLCLARIGWGIYVFFRRARNKENPCDSCVSGCDLKHLMDEKREKCKTERKSTKKKCCR